MQNDPYLAKASGKKRLSLSNDVANRIVEKIRQDSFAPGSRLPSEFELAGEFVRRCVARADEQNGDSREGVPFEAELPWLTAWAARREVQGS